MYLQEWLQVLLFQVITARLGQKVHKFGCVVVTGLQRSVEKRTDGRVRTLERNRKREGERDSEKETEIERRQKEGMLKRTREDGREMSEGKGKKETRQRKRFGFLMCKSLSLVDISFLKKSQPCIWNHDQGRPWDGRLDSPQVSGCFESSMTRHSQLTQSSIRLPNILQHFLHLRTC